METWTFNTSWHGSDIAALLAKDTVVLHLGGIDTKAAVYLNGKQIASVNNYYRWVQTAEPEHSCGRQAWLAIAYMMHTKTKSSELNHALAANRLGQGHYIELHHFQPHVMLFYSH
jgi:hypothetical protein